MKGPAHFQGEIIIEYQKYIDKILKIVLTKTNGVISTKRSRTRPWVMGIQYCSNEGSCHFKGEIITKMEKIFQQTSQEP